MVTRARGWVDPREIKIQECVKCQRLSLESFGIWLFGVSARRLGEAILEMLKALRGLGFEASAPRPVLSNLLKSQSVAGSNALLRECRSKPFALFGGPGFNFAAEPKLQGI